MMNMKNNNVKDSRNALEKIHNEQNFKTNKNGYKIKNIMKKKIFVKDFGINPFNIIILILFYASSFILYYLFGGDITNIDLQSSYIFLIIPFLGILNLAIGKWEISIIYIILTSALSMSMISKGAVFFTIPSIFAIIFPPMFQITKEWDRAVILRFGKFNKVKGPGLFIILPFSDSINRKVDLRIRVTDFEAETTLTKDSVSVIVDALAFWMIWDAEKAILEVENFIDAVVLSAQAALRDAIGKNSLTTLLEKREEVAESIRQMVDRKTNEWGITIQSIDITDIIIPHELLDVLSKKAQAEREKQSRIILGEAEVEVSKKIVEAAEIYKNNETALRLRGMNILYEGLKSGNSMMMVPSSILDSKNMDNLFGIQALNEINKNKKKQKKKEENK